MATNKMTVLDGLYVHEVFDNFVEAKTKKEKIKILQENNHHAVRDIIRGGMDPKIVFLLPKGKPPYQAARPESAPSNLIKRNTDFNYFIKSGQGDNMSAVKRESMFINLLESIHPADAELVLNMVEKKPPCKGMTKKIVEEAYPGLL